jgi:predicted porin
MRKATLFSSLALAACSAMAQSTVSLSGVADAAGRSVSNTGSGSLRSMVSGSNSTSRLAFRGTEDLGGGLSAGFHMETGVALDTGANTTASQFHDRRSTISLFGKGWGELRAGRDFVPSYVGWSRFDPFGYVGVGGSNNLVSATPTGPIRSAFSTNPNTTVRSSKSLQWFLPLGWAGVEGGVMVAAREGGLAPVHTERRQTNQRPVWCQLCGGHGRAQSLGGAGQPCGHCRPHHHQRQ